MKIRFALVLIAAMQVAHASDTIDLKSEQELLQLERSIFSAHPYSTVSANLARQAQKPCPNGYEKMREYSAPEGEAWYLHFVIRCLQPATFSSSVSPEPK
ncbi:MAG: hypothetical protein Q7U97_07270 [Rhodocyclaceae bacterium]|nr:hypothetical protein [Rhodocyclaceae bacterium]